MSKQRRLITLLLALALLIPCAPASAAAPSYTDTAGHWAEAAIERWSGYGVLQGNAGKFSPNAPITKAQLAAVLNRMLNYPVASENPYKDVFTGDWFYNDMLAMSSSGIIRTSDGYAEPNEPLSREEAVYMIAQAFGVKRMSFNDKPFTDVREISPFAYASVLQMKSYSFINGNPDGSFRPSSSISRAEIVTVLDNMVQHWVNEPGVYAFPEKGNILITCGNVEIEEHNAEFVFVSPGTEHTTVKIHTQKDLPSVVFMIGWSDHNLIAIGEDKPPVFFRQIWDKRALDNIFGEFESGKGTSDDPFIIKNQQQLELLNILYDMDDLYYKLDNDIIITGPWYPITYRYRNVTIDPRKLSNSTSFTGHIDGGGYTISGLLYSGSSDSSGLHFGLIQNLAGSVSRLKTEGIISMDNVKNSVFAGGIAASSYGIIDNCYVKIDISGDLTADAFIGGIAGRTYGSTISDCAAAVKIDARAGNEGFIGGIVGCATLGQITRPSMSGCEADVDINFNAGKNCRVGGIVGYTNGPDFSGCVSRGSIRAYGPQSDNEEYNIESGGLAGCITNAKLAGCKSSVDVLAEGGCYTFAGGIAGHVSRHGSNTSRQGSVTLSYSTGNVSAGGALMQNNAGGAVGQVAFGTVDSCWAEGNVSAYGSPGYFNAAGGFAGSCYEGGSIENCYSRGNVSAVDDFLYSYGGFVGRLGGSVANCYSTGRVEVTDSKGASYTDYVIVGSGRNDGHVVSCFDLMDSARGYPVYVTQQPGKPDTIERLSIRDASVSSTFTGKGWDFDTIWVMPGSTDSYKLPVLRGVSEAEQRALAMPSHLR